MLEIYSYIAENKKKKISHPDFYFSISFLPHSEELSKVELALDGYNLRYAKKSKKA